MCVCACGSSRYGACRPVDPLTVVCDDLENLPSAQQRAKRERFLSFFVARHKRGTRRTVYTSRTTNTHVCNASVISIVTTTEKGASPFRSEGKVAFRQCNRRTTTFSFYQHVNKQNTKNENVRAVKTVTALLEENGESKVRRVCWWHNNIFTTSSQ